MEAKNQNMTAEKTQNEIGKPWGKTQREEEKENWDNQTNDGPMAPAMIGEKIPGGTMERTGGQGGEGKISWQEGGALGEEGMAEAAGREKSKEQGYSRTEEEREKTKGEGRRHRGEEEGALNSKKVSSQITGEGREGNGKRRREEGEEEMKDLEDNI